MKKITRTITAILTIVFVSCTNHQAEKPGKVLVQDTVSQTSSNETKTGIKYETYCNQRYHFCIDYPTGYLIPRGESYSQDGQTFTSADSANSLLAYRDLRDNIDPDVKFNLETTYQEDLKDTAIKEITYKKMSKDFYVISGYKKNDKIFYQKSMISDGQLMTCVLEYTKADKAIYDKISERIFKSFE